jgi:CRP/FNR family transcriptional regulator, cyclic AMP receptor protein
MQELLEELAREPRQPGTPGRLRRYSAGEVIAHEGDLADTLHLVRKGRVAVSVTTRYGNQVTFTVLGPGDVFGELALLSSESRRSAGLIALDATETVTLGKAEFDRLRMEHPEFGEALTSLLAERVRRLSDQLVEALYVPADTRVLRRLLTVARLYDADEVPLAQDDLAGLAGTARATVNRVLRAEVKRGTLELRRRRIRILDRAAIEKRAL